MVGLKVGHASLCVVLEEVVVVVMEGNHRDLGAPMVEKVVVQSQQRDLVAVGVGMACQIVPLRDVLPFFALEVQVDESKLRAWNMLTIMQ